MLTQPLPARDLLKHISHCHRVLLPAAMGIKMTGSLLPANGLYTHPAACAHQAVRVIIISCSRNAANLGARMATVLVRMTSAAVVPCIEQFTKSSLPRTDYCNGKGLGIDVSPSANLNNRIGIQRHLVIDLKGCCLPRDMVSRMPKGLPGNSSL